jgi:Tfp pilus assembly protein FimV
MHMAHTHHFHFSRFLKALAAPMALVLLTQFSWASDPSTAALRVLLGSADSAQQAEATTTGNAANRGERRTITLMRGETLDRAVRRALPGLPLHPDFLRQAFVTVNPQVFPKGAAHAMRSGTTLQVPTADELRFMLMSQYPETVALFQVVEATPSAEQSPQQSKRHWVRFP